MITIGVVNIDVSHPKAFASLLENENRARYVAVYNDGFREDDEVEGFIKKFLLEKRYNDLSVLIGDSPQKFTKILSASDFYNIIQIF